MKKIWVNDGKTVTEYVETSERHRPAPAPVVVEEAAPAPVVVEEAAPRAVVVEEPPMVETPTQQAVEDPDHVPDTSIDPDAKPSGFYDRVKSAARATPGAAVAASGRAAQWAQAIRARYDEVQPGLSKNYKAIARNIAAAAPPPKKRRRARTTKRKLKTGPSSGAPVIKIVYRK